ncbi:winged helix-turn-helix transcriptional regulator [Streptomyces sp. AV19]|nr:winged helix-turn-helix domain-containing protein [Streptomyces sp. AV19]MBH1934278.1 winged helix-turn-helix transcriptional regulator [Streptomyces sp. AV19]MDG4533411.1 winged helix-turn-helix domain-containing protein [Streptomyces sp. AV19]
MPERSQRGTYTRIADALRLRLTEEPDQSVLPSEAALMREYGVARTTVRRALRALAAQGLVEAVPGVGWRVRTGGDTPSPLVDRVRSLLVGEGFAVGDAFYSEAALCGRYDISRTTVRRALAQLEGEGLLEAVHGKGRIVKALPPEAGTP